MAEKATVVVNILTKQQRGSFFMGHPYTANIYFCVSQGSDSGEVGEFIIFLCEISSGYCTPKIIEIDSVFVCAELFNN